MLLEQGKHQIISTNEEYSWSCHNNDQYVVGRKTQ